MVFVVGDAMSEPPTGATWSIGMSGSLLGREGLIFEIQRFSLHDGPGIRTTVFLKGCSLRCLWCHNPEGIATARALSFQADRCIGCGYCMRVCPRGAVTAGPDGQVTLDRSRCVVCGLCTRECYARALEMVGRRATVRDVLDEVLRDRDFYRTSGGGLTLSGGEPALQPEFASVLLQAAREAQLHTAVETAGHARAESYDLLRPWTDLFLFDIKETDPARHVEYTGKDNDLILSNLRRLHDAGAAIILRLPIVPGLNDRKDHFQAVARLVASLPAIQGVDVLPYHRLGAGKHARIGLAPPRVIDAPDEDDVARWRAMLADLNVAVI